MDKNYNDSEATLKEISDLITHARASKSGLSHFPINVPESLEAAYRIQDLSIEKWPDEIVGWKVGGIPQSWQARFDDSRLSGPIYASNVKRVNGERVIDMPVFAEGYAGIEAEFIIELGNTEQLPGSGLTEAEIKQSITNVYIGAEIAGSPIQRINDYGPTAPISDFGNNAGMIIGPEIANWRERDLSEIEVSVDIDGKIYGPTAVPAGLGGPFGATKFLIEQLKRRGHQIPTGTYISTGAITGVHDSEVGARSTITFTELGSFRLQLISNKD